MVKVVKFIGDASITNNLFREFTKLGGDCCAKVNVRNEVNVR